jgi:tetratricopeptide (TPR) repeat protein
MLARSYDLAGNADSAIAVYERFLDTPLLERIDADAVYLPGVHKRLGELYEARGQRDKALDHYRAFISLWKDADPELQPKVTDARQRVAALTKGTDGRR